MINHFAELFQSSLIMHSSGHSIPVLWRIHVLDTDGWIARLRVLSDEMNDLQCLADTSTLA